MDPLIDEADRLLLIKLLPRRHPLAKALRARPKLEKLEHALAVWLDKEDWDKAKEAFRAYADACFLFAPYYSHRVVRYETMIWMEMGLSRQEAEAIPCDHPTNCTVHGDLHVPPKGQE